MSSRDEARHADTESTWSDPAERERERTLERFEQAWLAGKLPTLSEFAPHEADGRLQPLLIQLIDMDLEYRIKSGGTIRVEEYVQRYPCLADNRDDLIDLIVSEFRLRKCAAPELDIEDPCRRFPEHATELRRRTLRQCRPG